MLAGTTPVLVHNCDPVYRVDGRSHEDIFKNGFSPKGDNLNIEEHAAGVTGQYGISESGYVATTTSKSVALARQATGGGNVYEICGNCVKRGVDVNKALGGDNVYSHEREIAVPGRIDSSCIVSCTLPNGRVIPNPNYGK